MKLLSIFVAAVFLIPLTRRPKTKLKFFRARASPHSCKLWRKRRKRLRAVGLHSATMDRMQSNSQCELRAAEPKCMRTMMTCSW